MAYCSLSGPCTSTTSPKTPLPIGRRNWKSSIDTGPREVSDEVVGAEESVEAREAVGL